VGGSCFFTIIRIVYAATRFTRSAGYRKRPPLTGQRGKSVDAFTWPGNFVGERDRRGVVRLPNPEEKNTGVDRTGSGLDRRRTARARTVPAGVRLGAVAVGAVHAQRAIAQLLGEHGAELERRSQLHVHRAGQVVLVQQR